MKLAQLFGTRRTGDDAERIAEIFLVNHGLRVVARNYHCRYGEIDLIMRENETLVFVEVKLRRVNSGKVDFGGALASITKSKQTKLITTAQHYLAGMKQLPPCRFDAVLLNGMNADGVEWLRNAFEA
jgi:putative endonuclease